jgi:L-amino acid N-acyltransferase YncA
MPELSIRPMSSAVWDAVAAIYQEGIDTGMATFEVAPPGSWDDWQKSKINDCSLVACDVNGGVGWAALSPVSLRRCYSGVAEVSIYVGSAARGAGVGTRLLAALIGAAEAHGIWTLQATVLPENQASMHLLQKHDFRIVGRRERIARMEIGVHKGKWRDTLLLERRSQVVGCCDQRDEER